MTVRITNLLVGTVLALMLLVFVPSQAVSGDWQTARYAPWYGPGFYGDVTACGQVMTRRLRGVAHRTLPCGTRVRLKWKGHVVTTKVVDRGPYPAPYLYDEMPFDLTARTNCWDLNGGKYQHPCPSRRNIKYIILGR